MLLFSAFLLFLLANLSDALADSADRFCTKADLLRRIFRGEFAGEDQVGGSVLPRARLMRHDDKSAREGGRALSKSARDLHETFKWQGLAAHHESRL